MLLILLSVLATTTAAPHAIERLGVVDLGILAESTPIVWKGELTPIVWKGELWLFECIQGGRYYDNINAASYPNAPQPPGYLRFTNPRTGERSAPFGQGYGLGNALVVDGRLFVFATAVPWGISGNNTVVSVFWSDDMASWDTAVALRTSQPNLFPRNASFIARKLWNTSVRRVPAGSSSTAGGATYAMSYEFNDPAGGGWQTGFASTHDPDLRTARWAAVPRPSTPAADLWGSLAHANPTLRYHEADGYWYVLSTRATNGVMATEVWRARDPFAFDWQAPRGWRADDVTAAPFLLPSHEDQKPVPRGWHPDTLPAVRANATALDRAANDNQLGPTAMVLSVAVAKNVTEGGLLASYF
eukprot:g7714.t1